MLLLLIALLQASAVDRNTEHEIIILLLSIKALPSTSVESESFILSFDQLDMLPEGPSLCCPLSSTSPSSKKKSTSYSCSQITDQPLSHAFTKALRALTALASARPSPHLCPREPFFSSTQDHQSLTKLCCRSVCLQLCHSRALPWTL